MFLELFIDIFTFDFKAGGPCWTVALSKNLFLLPPLCDSGCHLVSWKSWFPRLGNGYDWCECLSSYFLLKKKKRKKLNNYVEFPSTRLIIQFVTFSEVLALCKTPGQRRLLHVTQQVPPRGELPNNTPIFSAHPINKCKVTVTEDRGVRQGGINFLGRWSYTGE